VDSRAPDCWFAGPAHCKGSDTNMSTKFLYHEARPQSGGRPHLPGRGRMSLPAIRPSDRRRRARLSIGATSRALSPDSTSSTARTPNGRWCNAKATGDLAGRYATNKLQPKNFAHLAHGGPLCWHSVLLWQPKDRT
jgi:hypothetical protein